MTYDIKLKHKEITKIRQALMIHTVYVGKMWTQSFVCTAGGVTFVWKQVFGFFLRVNTYLHIIYKKYIHKVAFNIKFKILIVIHTIYALTYSRSNHFTSFHVHV